MIKNNSRSKSTFSYGWNVYNRFNKCCSSLHKYLFSHFPPTSSSATIFSNIKNAADADNTRSIHVFRNIQRHDHFKKNSAVFYDVKKSSRVLTPGDNRSGRRTVRPTGGRMLVFQMQVDYVSEKRRRQLGRTNVVIFTFPVRIQRR